MLFINNKWVFKHLSQFSNVQLSSWKYFDKSSIIYGTYHVMEFLLAPRASAEEVPSWSPTTTKSGHSLLLLKNELIGYYKVWEFLTISEAPYNHSITFHTSSWPQWHACLSIQIYCPIIPMVLVLILLAACTSLVQVCYILQYILKCRSNSYETVLSINTEK